MRTLIIAALAALFGFLPAVARADSVNIYAAASTAEALDEILALYGADTGREVTAVYAASSTLARQITAGAPADLFLSANVAWMDDLETRELIAPGSRENLLSNRLALVAPRMLPLGWTPGSGQSLAEAIGDGRLAMGDPSGVPAGIYAREAL